MTLQSHHTGRDNAQTLGAFGENLVARYFENRGYSILARNWRVPEGELDIVCALGTVLVAVEVKTRRSTEYGAPLEAITYRKARKLRRLLAMWARTSSERWGSLRVDGVGVTLRRGTEPLIEHIEGLR